MPPPPPRDVLGLARDHEARLLPWLVAFAGLLAALALAGAIAVDAFATRWERGATAHLTVQVPEPDAPAAAPATGEARVGQRQAGQGQEGQTRLAAVLAALRGIPGVALAEPIPRARLLALLEPWLGGEGSTLAQGLPGVIEVTAGRTMPAIAELRAAVEAAAPGAVVEGHGVWVRRLLDLAASLRAIALLAAAAALLVCAGLVVFAVRASIAAHREDLAIVHGLGASDGWLARRFARRFGVLGLWGGVLALALAVPALLALALLAAPFASEPASVAAAGSADSLARLRAAALLLPPSIWAVLALLPAAIGLVSAVTASITARLWLRRLP
ncbi:MAG: hypothetical protein IT557_17585 [Alphaproteobacteria bacterium]|nr:hypothetical protein [Alphaproteobacteria bacterium]